VETAGSTDVSHAPTETIMTAFLKEINMDEHDIKAQEWIDTHPNPKVGTPKPVPIKVKKEKPQDDTRD